MSLVNHNGRIEVIYGPMFSGKSSELLRRIRRYTVAKKRCLVLKYDKDIRYDKECLSTHDLIKWEAHPCSQLETTVKMAEDFDVIGIDEGQFFVDIVDYCERMANKGKIVVVAALDGNFMRGAFGHIHELLPCAEEVLKLNAVCVHCSRDAAFTKRIGSDTRIELIGGLEDYMAVCRACYFNETK